MASSFTSCARPWSATLPENFATITVARWPTTTVLLMLLTMAVTGCGRNQGPSFDQTLRIATLDLEADRQALQPAMLTEYIRVLRDWAPDVVFLQGVRQDRDLPGGWMDVRILAAELGLPHMVGAPEEGSELRYWGNTAAMLPAMAIVSRYPLRDRRELGYVAEAPLPGDAPDDEPPHAAWDPAEPEGLLLLGATLTWGGQPLRLWTTRLSDDPLGADQFSQVVELMRVTREAGEPFMTVGRFPIPPRLEPMRLLQEEWRDAWVEAGSGLGYTHRTPVPRARESVVFMSRRSGLRVLRIFPVGILAGSGRGLPLLTDLRFEAAPPTLMERMRQRDATPQGTVPPASAPPPVPGRNTPSPSEATPAEPATGPAGGGQGALPRPLSPATRSLVPGGTAPRPDRSMPGADRPNRNSTPRETPTNGAAQGSDGESSAGWEALLDRYQP